MTDRPLRPCAACGRVSRGRCSCRPARRRWLESPTGRPTGRTASADGYGARWYRYSVAFRSRYPFCGARPSGYPPTGDSVCQAAGRLVPCAPGNKRSVVDHITPVTGPHDPRFYDQANHQTLCQRCHNQKRHRERGGG